MSHWYQNSARVIIWVIGDTLSLTKFGPKFNVKIDKIGQVTI